MNDEYLNEVKTGFKAEFPEYSFLWRHERETHGDIDISALLLEVFGVPAGKKLEFVRKARQLRRECETRIGRKIILVSHTPEATEEFYSHLFGKVKKKPVTYSRGKKKPLRIKEGPADEGRRQ